MRVSGFRVERQNRRVRAVADVVWEDCEREQTALYFEVDEHHAGGMTANPDAFLLAVVVPALRFAEQRIAVDGHVCPVLLEGLETALPIIASWHYPARETPPRIEVADKRPDFGPHGARQAGVFFSGGIDSYATIHLNARTYPRDHPYRFREGVLVYGLEQDDPSRFEHVASALGRAADEFGLSLTTVATNIYQGYRQQDGRDGYKFWYTQFEGSALAAIAHSLGHRLASLSISSTLSPRAAILSPHTLEPSGSQLMLDHCYASGGMRIHHAGAGLTRLQKTALVVELGVAPRHLRVCNQYRHYTASALNCGQCSKCLMTKLALVSLGREDLLAAFVTGEVTAALVRRRVRFKDAHDLDVYSELVAPLAARGYADVARALRREAALYRLLGPHKGLRQLPERVLRRATRLFARGRQGVPSAKEPRLSPE
jgi:hypothetical protein